MPRYPTQQKTAPRQHRQPTRDTAGFLLDCMTSRWIDYGYRCRYCHQVADSAKSMASALGARLLGVDHDSSSERFPMRVHRTISMPIRDNVTWEARWQGPDRGLIGCWERGREKAKEDPELAAEAKSGRLVVLPFKGGVEKPIKGKKVGTLLYLAMWRGLRNEDLDIDLSEESVLTCSITNVTVVYTGDYEKYKNG